MSVLNARDFNMIANSKSFAKSTESCRLLSEEHHPRPTFVMDCEHYYTCPRHRVTTIIILCRQTANYRSLQIATDGENNEQNTPIRYKRTICMQNSRPRSGRDLTQCSRTDQRIQSCNPALQASPLCITKFLSLF